MPYIEKLDILTTNCSTIDAQEAQRAENAIQRQLTARVQDVNNTTQT